MIVVRCFLLILMMVMLSPLEVQANEAVISLTLDEAEQLWQQHNRETRLAAIAVRGAEADLLVAGQALNPQLSVNIASISPNEGFGAGNVREKKMDSIVRLEQTIERGDKRELRTQAADARREAAQRDLDDTRRQQRLALWNAYYDLMLAQEKKRSAEDTAQLYRKSLDASQARLKAGDISVSEHARLRVEKLRADNDARQAEADCSAAQVTLAYLIGRENVAGKLLATDSWRPLDTESVVTAESSLILQRPDVRAAQARVTAAEAARDLARSQKKRDVTIGMQMEHNLQNAPRNSFGVGISVPLFVRSEYQGEIARAESDLDLAREQLQKVVAQARGDADQMLGQLTASAERRQRLENELLADAERVARAAEFAYAKGATGLIDLLDARRTWRQVQLEAAQARADHAKAHAAWHMLIALENPKP